MLCDEWSTTATNRRMLLMDNGLQLHQKMHLATIDKQSIRSSSSILTLQQMHIWRFEGPMGRRLAFIERDLHEAISMILHQLYHSNQLRCQLQRQ
jgi:hypothetical protein